MSKPRALSLFSGIGLHDLGLQRAGWQIIGQVEMDPWCLAVLEKHWPGLWRMEDVRDVTAAALSGLGRIDLVTGGFPCPDISSAGRGVGLLRGERSSLWLEMLRIIKLVRPAWVLAENVPALRTRGIDTVLSGLEEAGYSAWPVVVGAWAVGAPHRRDRVWIIGRRVAVRSIGGVEGERLSAEGWSEVGDIDGCGKGLGNAAGAQLEAGLPRPELQGQRRWECEPGGSGTRLAHTNGGALRHESEHELGGGSAPKPGGPSAAGVAYGDGAGLAFNGSESRDARPERPPALGGGRPGLADAEGGGWAPEGECGREPEEPGPGFLGARWPARRGEPQHQWEPPRLTESGLGRGTDGRACRLDGFARRNRLKALGNANPPHVPEIIGRWMLATLASRATEQGALR